MATVQQIVLDIKAVKIQGAREVAKAGLKALSITAEKSRAKTRKQFLQELQKTARKLIEARPTERALKGSLAKVLARVHGSSIRNIKLLKRYTVRACEDLTGQLKTALLQPEAVPLLLVDELMRTGVPTVHRKESLDSVLDKFARANVPALAIESDGGATEVEGLITHQAVIARYQQELDRQAG